MPNKITLDTVKSKIPSFLKIIDESYRGVRYKAKFIDLDYNEEFEAVIKSVIKLQHGCPSRSNNLRSKAGMGKKGRNSKTSLDEFKNYLPPYLTIYEDTYKDLRTKAKFKDVEYNSDFWAYPCNIKRDKKGYCKERQLDEFRKKIIIPAEEIQKRIDNFYGEGIIKLIPETYKGTNEIAVFEIEKRGKVKCCVQNALTGFLCDDRYQKQAWRNSVIEKWGNKCAISGEATRLEAHHIFSKSTSPELTLDPNNGICLNKKIHDEFHSKYGRKYNTLTQLIKFAKEKGADLIPHLVTLNNLKFNQDKLSDNFPLVTNES